MYDGKISKELITSETTEDEILYYSAGGKLMPKQVKDGKRER